MPSGSRQAVYPTDSASSSSASANSAKAISASRARAVPRLRTFLYRPHLISASMNDDVDADIESIKVEGDFVTYELTIHEE